jgi:hypothetical protein
MTAVKIPNGWIAYEGVSQLDEQPIACIITGTVNFSTNRKTGPMLQSWILRSDLHPKAALNTGADASVCGNCKLRKNSAGKRVCYVNPIGLSQVYSQYRAGKYNYLPNFEYVKALRIGSYGDPTAVPIEVWQKLISQVATYTGYTQNWHQSQFQNYKSLCMASVSSPQEASAAHRLGWKTYRVKTAQEPILLKEVYCPAAKPTADLNCKNCHLCNGQTANICINVHGINYQHFKT